MKQQPELPGDYLPLWPFSSPEEVVEWQEAYRANGSQPWHLSADDTAVGFARDFLGFDEIDGVRERKADGGHARVTVGYSKGEGGEAAIVHLVRFGSGEDAPWEVVGTDDETFSVTEPSYGAAVGGQIKVGGKISGVDENIRVRVVQRGEVIGEACCQPAGGEDTPWSDTVTVRKGARGLATIVASTGGHIAEVERFAITGVRLG